MSLIFCVLELKSPPQKQKKYKEILLGFSSLQIIALTLVEKSHVTGHCVPG